MTNHHSISPVLILGWPTENGAGQRLITWDTFSKQVGVGPSRRPAQVSESWIIVEWIDIKLKSCVFPNSKHRKIYKSFFQFFLLVSSCRKTIRWHQLSQNALFLKKLRAPIKKTSVTSMDQGKDWTTVPNNIQINNKVWQRIENKTAVRLSWKRVRFRSTEKNPNGDHFGFNWFCINSWYPKRGTPLYHWKILQEYVISDTRFIRFVLNPVEDALLPKGSSRVVCRWPK